MSSTSRSTEGLRKDRLKKLEHWVEIVSDQGTQADVLYRSLRLHNAKLTPTEARIAALVAMGRLSWEIANIFGISERAVENHRVKIRAKFDLDAKASLKEFLHERLLKS